MKRIFLNAACTGSGRRASLLLWLALGCLLGMSACADKDPPLDNSAMLPENERVSSVPWNKPQGWENKGPLGALANDPRFGGGNN